MRMRHSRGRCVVCNRGNEYDVFQYQSIQQVLSNVQMKVNVVFNPPKDVMTVSAMSDCSVCAYTLSMK